MARLLVTDLSNGDLALGLTVAAAAGLLIGIERERRKGEGPSRAAAGARTFTLLAVMGAISAALGDAIVVAAGLAFVGAIAIASYVTVRGDDPGLTTEVALVVTFLLGALAIDRPVVASGLAVVVAVMLASRDAMHRIVKEAMTEHELHDLLLFAAAAAVALPLLPDRAMGPYGALNPFATWRLVVLVMGIGGAGHIALRALGPRYGLPIGGLAGGFVSSAATVATMGSLVRQSPGLRRAAVAGAVLSTVATLIQLGVVLATGSLETLRLMWPALALGGLAAASSGVLAAWKSEPADGLAQSAPRRAFDVRAALVFALLVSGTAILAAAANDLLGERGVPLAAALAGFVDAHAAAASAAALVESGDVSGSLAVVAILAGVTTNTVTKAALAYIAGGPAFARPVWLGLAAVMGATWAGSAAVLI